MSSPQRRLGYRLAAFGLLFIGLLTLLPDDSSIELAASTPLTCIICGQVGGVDFFLNILLFIPLGLGLGLAGFSWRRSLVLAFLLSSSIELLQMKLIVGRDASLGDVITNTAGGGLGALIAARWRQILFPQERVALRLAAGWAVALLLVWSGAAWAMGVALPFGTRWYGQWAADLGYLAPFPGTPLAVSAGGVGLPPGPSMDQAGLEDAVAEDPSVAVRAILATPPRRFAPIGSVMDADRREVIFLGQERRDLAFRIRTRAALLKLRVPTVNLKNGMDGQPGDTVDAEGTLRSGAYVLSSRIRDVVRTRTLPLSASWGWSLVTPWNSVLGEEVHQFTALWIAGLMALLAYWSVQAGGAALAIPPVTGALMIGAVPLAAGFPPAHWSEWVAALVGMTIGAVLTIPARQKG